MCANKNTTEHVPVAEDFDATRLTAATETGEPFNLATGVEVGGRRKFICHITSRLTDCCVPVMSFRSAFPGAPVSFSDDTTCPFELRCRCDLGGNAQSPDASKRDLVHLGVVAAGVHR